MNYRNVSEFTKGLLTAGFGRGKAPLNSLLKAVNVRVHTGTVTPRHGSRNICGTALVASGTINSLYEFSKEYYHTGYQDTRFYREYVFAKGDTIYSWSEETPATVWEINLPLSPITDDNIWCMPYMDWLYIGNGVDPLYKYDLIEFFEVGIAAPAAAPNVIPGVTATTEPIGYKKYKYRYNRATIGLGGNLTDYVCSPFSPEATYAVRTKVNSIVQVIGSLDPQVTNIEVYATKMFDDVKSLDGATFYRLDYNALHGDTQVGLTNIDGDCIDDVTNTNFDTYSTRHPAEDLTEDWTAPPDGLKFLLVYRDRLYGVTSDDPTTVRYSFLGEPDAWPDDNFIDINKDDGDAITGLAVRGSSLYIFKNRSIWVLTGDPDAAAVLQVKTGGEATPTTTEFGLGCTAPRSIATYGDDTVIFYSAIHGVYMISGGDIRHLSKSVDGILNLSDSSAGAVWVDEAGEIFYVLMSPTGSAWICHLQSGTWANDAGLNCSCLCVDHNGWLLGPVGTNIRRFYHPDYTDDQGVEFDCNIKTAWLNLRDGDMDAVVRGMLIQSESLIDLCTLTLENDAGDTFVTTFTGSDRNAGINGLAGRLFSADFLWRKGNIESITYLFRRRRGH